MMKKFLLVFCLTAIISIPAFAHDGTLTDPAGDGVSSWDGVDYVHDPDASPYKGLATMIFQNNLTLNWTGFQFKISAPGGGVFFEDTDSFHGMYNFPSGTVYDGGTQAYSIAYSDYYDFGGTIGLKPTTMEFQFAGEPVLPTEYVKFDVYTDNTSVPNEYFTICATPTPEPMTVALLGLGGIFLARRRK